MTNNDRCYERRQHVAVNELHNAIVENHLVIEHEIGTVAYLRDQNNAEV